MKPIRSLLLGGLLLSATSIAMAQPPHDHDGDRDHDNHGHDNRNDHRDDHHDNGGHGWQRGHALPPQYRDRGHYVTDYRSHRLREPPRGYRWVRTDDSFVLVAITTGLIADIVANSQ